MTARHGVTVRLAVCVIPFVPEIVTVFVLETVWVVTVNMVVVLPAVAVTLRRKWVPKSNCWRV